MYLIRFDDICPTMRWSVWNCIEEILLHHDVHPILSVVPDNRDPKLEFDKCPGNFWDRVRTWQARGWTIGMHGYQHQYTSAASGIVGIKGRSEFAGIPFEEQRAKLEAAAEIFRREAVIPEVWVAPGHSFDLTTVRLLQTIGISCISDGLFLLPRVDPHGIMWVPQQLWRFRRMPFGVWTICLHHNRWSDADLAAFADKVVAYKRRIVTFNAVVRLYTASMPTPIDRVLPHMMLQFMRFKRFGASVISSLGNRL